MAPILSYDREGAVDRNAKKTHTSRMAAKKKNETKQNDAARLSTQANRYWKSSLGGMNAS